MKKRKFGITILILLIFAVVLTVHTILMPKNINELLGINNSHKQILCIEQTKEGEDLSQKDLVSGSKSYSIIEKSFDKLICNDKSYESTMYIGNGLYSLYINSNEHTYLVTFNEKGKMFYDGKKYTVDDGNFYNILEKEMKK